jgi:hypothetical protein
MPICQTSELWQVFVEVNCTNYCGVELVEGIMAAAAPAVAYLILVSLSALV